ncbi:MAG: T9SS type A sorting domain-containing protein, partial [Bacteroidales bacterium]|nr:T9SS type A sorting domain-containing protein [Bacteroidales bacterium]
GLVAQGTYSGKLVLMANPPLEDPALPGLVLGLETDSENFILTQNAHWITQLPLEWGGISYAETDEVTIIGTIRSLQDSHGDSYTELEIQNMQKKVLSNTGDISPEEDVFYIMGEQVLHIKNGSGAWILEIFDSKGQTRLTEVGTGERQVPMTDYPSGIYIYRIIRDGRISTTGKIVKQ